MRVVLFLAPAIVLVLCLPLLPRLARWSDLSSYPGQAGAGRFRLYSPVERTDLEERARLLEAFYAALYREVCGAVGLVEVSGPVSVLVFPDHAAIADYVWQKKRKRFQNNEGYYDPGARLIAIARGDARGLRHEAVHMALHLGNPALHAHVSPWLDEGLAQLFEGADPAGGRLEAARARMYDDDAGDERVGPAQVVGSVNEQYRGEDNHRYYRAAYELASYLWHRHRPAFLQYIREDLKPGVTGTMLLFQTVGLSPENLERDMEAWLRDE